MNTALTIIVESLIRKDETLAGLARFQLDEVHFDARNGKPEHRMGGKIIHKWLRSFASAVKHPFPESFDNDLYKQIRLIDSQIDNA